MYAFASVNRLELAVTGFYIDTHYGSVDRYTSELKHCDDNVFGTQRDFRLDSYGIFRIILYG